MGFEWDKYESSGGAYVAADEKKVIADSGIPFEIVKVREELENRFDQPRYVLTVMLPSPETGDVEERLMSFPIGSGVESRDNLLADLQTYVAEEGPVTAKLDKVGRSYLIRQA